jgi:ABC-2 type transport system permease protein
MRWYHVFVKGIREQVRDYWILVMIIVMAPLFIAIYFLMSDPGELHYDVVLVNLDTGMGGGADKVNMGDSLLRFLQESEKNSGLSNLSYTRGESRELTIGSLQKGDADVLLVIPSGLSCLLLSNPADSLAHGATDEPDPTFLKESSSLIELVGDVTKMEYIVGAIWTEEMVNAFLMEASGIRLPVRWKETTLGHSGERSEFELYVPGLLILSIIMIIFSASAAIVREPETRTLERLKVSRLTSAEFLWGTSLVQILISVLSLALALLTALALGYTLVPGSLGFILLVSLLTTLSMISFSLIVAAMCRSIKEVAIIGTFPLFLLMFFTGSAFPITGGKLFSIGGYEVMLNDILSPKWAVGALNKVLVRGMEVRDTLPDMVAITLLTVLYFILGTWAFRRRHMRAG